MAILSTVAKLEGIKSMKSMDIDAENCKLTVVGTVDPVAIVLELKKACLKAVIIGVEDDRPKEPEPEKEDDPCDCEKGCVLPNCCYYGASRPAPYGYGWYW